MITCYFYIRYINMAYNMTCIKKHLKNYIFDLEDLVNEVL